MHIGPDHVMGRRRRSGNPALDLWRRNPVGHDRKRLRRVVTGLHFHRRPVMVVPSRRGGVPVFSRPKVNHDALE